MRFFDEKDFLTYQEFLTKSINDVIKSLTDKDKSIKAVLIGEFSDGVYRFVTFHPYSDIIHVHHKEFDHLASLLLDIAPMGMNMFIVEITEATNGSFSGTK